MILPNAQPDATRPEPSEEVLRAFNEWLAKDRLLGRNPNNSQPPIAEGQTYTTPRVLRSEKLKDPDCNLKPRPSVSRRVFRTFAFGLAAVVIALGGILWQSEKYDLSDRVRSLRGLPSAPAPAPWQSVAASPNKSVLALPVNAVKQIVTPSQGVPVPRPTDEKHGAIQKQIEDLTTTISAIRNIVDQLAANQMQMGQTIAAIKAAQENLDQRLSSAASHSTAAHPAPRKRTSDLPPRRRPASTGQSVEPPLPLR